MDYVSMCSADVSDFTGRQVVALLIGAVRAERFCDGFHISLAEFFADESNKLQELTEDDLVFLETTRSLERNNRDRALAYMQAMKDVQKNE